MKLTQNQVSYVNLAIQEASKSPLEFQLGACLVSHGKVIAQSCNQDRGIAKFPSYILKHLPYEVLTTCGKFKCPSLHAETAVLFKMSQSTRNSGSKKRLKQSLSYLLRI